MIDMVECCETHTRLRKIDTTQASYWICGYANRQHSLESEIGDDPEQSSFRKAMNLADGVLLLLDENATPFTRIWCDFEVFCAVNDVEKGLDIMAKRRGVPQLLSDRQLPNETARAQTQREAKFPIALLVNGMHARLQDGETSKPSDKEAILQYVCQNSPDQEEILRRTNNTLHAIFAKSAWPQAVKRGLVEDFDRKNPGALRLPDVLRQNELQQSLHMSLEHMDMVTDAEVANIAAALPPNLSDLELSFEGCRNVSSRGLEAIALALPPRMRKLKLDFLGCSQMGDLGLRALAQQLPGQLQDLELHFDMCDNISIEGLRRLADGIPRCVRTFEGTFRGTQIDRNFASVRALQAFVDPGR